ncbi:MAG: polysaccharide deacetylase family protein [Candidatus Nealsonbacteria bacterium]
MKICFVSIDIESDLAKPQSFKGVENLDRIFNILKKHDISTTLFITGNVFEKYGDKVKAWSENHEIACHGFSHKFWSNLDNNQKKEELDRFIAFYRKIFNKNPEGFRAPSHIINDESLNLLEKKGFLYDSSVVPHYPFLKKYRGYKGRAPLIPYFPNYQDYRKKGEMRILEIPVSGVLSFPLAGTWILKLPFFVYKILLRIKSPDFLSLSFHSWDSLNDKVIIKLERLIKLLKNKGYIFLNGKQIYEQFSKN